MRFTLREFLLSILVICLAIPYLLPLISSPKEDFLLFPNLNSSQIVFDWAKKGDSSANPLRNGIIHLHSDENPFHNVADVYHFELDCNDSSLVHSAIIDTLTSPSADMGYQVVAKNVSEQQGVLELEMNGEQCLVIWTQYSPMPLEGVPAARKMYGLQLTQIPHQRNVRTKR